MDAQVQSLETAFLTGLELTLGRPNGLIALHEPEFAGNEWACVKERWPQEFGQWDK